MVNLLAAHPELTAIFADTGRALPLNTQILIFISSLLSDYLWLVLVLGIAGTVAFRRWLATPKGRLSWDTFKLKIPVLGGLERKVAVSRFAKTLSTMLASGVQLLRAMEIVEEGGITGDLWQTGGRRGDDGQLVLQRLDDRQPQPLEQRREHQH